MRAILGVVASLGLGAGTAAAQGERVDPGADLAVAVVVPAQTDLDERAQTQLASRLAQALTGTGFAAVPGGSPLVLYPTVVVLEESKVAGMNGNQSVVKLDLTVFIKNATDGALFASTSRTLGGVGANRTAAILNALSTLRGGDPGLAGFATSARGKIVGYYQRSCDRIIADGRASAGTGDPARAFAVLLSVPRDAEDCHRRASAEAIRLYAELQEKDCASKLRTARAEAAAKHYVDAIDALEGLDPSSPCAAEVDRLLAQIGREVEARDQAEADRAERALGMRLETIRSMRAGVASQLGTTEKVGERRLALAIETRVDFFNRRPPPVYSADLFR